MIFRACLTAAQAFDGHPVAQKRGYVFEERRNEIGLPLVYRGAGRRPHESRDVAEVGGVFGRGVVAVAYRQDVENFQIAEPLLLCDEFPHQHLRPCGGVRTDQPTAVLYLGYGP